MQKFAKFIDLNYIAGSSPHLVQGIKGGRTPSNAMAGGNGSFIIKGTPSKLILTVQTKDGKYIQLNIINIVRNILDRSRITEKLCDKLEKAFSTATFQVSEGNIINLEDILLNV